MSDKARDELIDKIRKYLTAFKRFNMDVNYQPREILEMIEQAGYMHPDDLAKGMVVLECTYEGYCPLKEIKLEYKMHVCEKCSSDATARPATVGEHLAGLAVKG